MKVVRAALEKAWAPGLLLVGAVLLGTLTLYASPYTVIRLTSILMYIVITVSWVVFSAPTGYLSLASAAFFGVGIYTSAILGRDLALPFVILIAGLVFGWEAALYAFVTLFMWGLVADYVLEGPSVVRTAFIVTDEPENVSQALLNRMGVGVTAWEGKGMFSKREHTTLFCALNRPDVKILTTIVNEVDPRAFVVIMQGHQARGGRLRQALQLNS